MSVITKGRIFANGEQLTAEKLNVLVEEASFNSSTAVDNSTTRVNASGAITVKPQGITSTELASGSVTKAKIENVSDMKVLGNTSGSDAAPQEVSVLDEDDMSSDSATAIATQKSIKAYVDSAPNFTPSTYAGGESVTLPNGLIMKFGTTSASINTTTDVNFAVHFPNAAVSAQLTQEHTGDADRFPLKIESLNTGTLTIRNTHGSNVTAHWQVIGY